MSGSGLLVIDWPLVLGVDAAGVVVEVGEKAASKFKVGDEVCGCTRLGSMGYSTCQDFFLMDADLTIPKPKNITLPQAATVGVASMV
jgi:NADPH:quinone reductase-like Zn-dependent oxidoreductase